MVPDFRTAFGRDIRCALERRHYSTETHSEAPRWVDVPIAERVPQQRDSIPDAVPIVYACLSLRARFSSHAVRDTAGVGFRPSIRTKDREAGPFDILGPLCFLM